MKAKRTKPLAGDDAKAFPPAGHVSPRRWMRYIARNGRATGKVKDPERYLHASRTQR